MSDEDGHPSSNRAKAVLLDADGLTVLWDSESAIEANSGIDGSRTTAPSLGDVIPMAQVIGLSAAAAEVAETGVPQQLSADVVKTSKGSMTFSCGVYRLPEGQVLVLAENGWRVSADRRSGRRGVST